MNGTSVSLPMNSSFSTNSFLPEIEYRLANNYANPSWAAASRASVAKLRCLSRGLRPTLGLRKLAPGGSTPRGQPQTEVSVQQPVRSYELVVLGYRFAICKFAPTAIVPSWVDHGSFWTATRTADELSIVCEENLTPAGVQAARGYSCIKVLGPFELDEVGVLANLTAALAANGVSVFAISTFDTDYLLVKEEILPDAIDALREAGHVVQF